MNLSWQHPLAFLVAIGLLVTVHEFGHYWVAQRLGFKVLRFSVGFGKALFSRTAGPDRTEYVIGMIPLGGYVKLLDEREGEVDPADLHRAFTRRPHWQRIAVLLAGSAFNIAFAILLLAGLHAWRGVTEIRPVVGEVAAGSHVGRAGLRPGDLVLALDGEPVAGQGDVALGLLDAVTGPGSAAIRVRGEDGRERQLLLQVTDPVERRRLSEPDVLFEGLGFSWWRPTLPAVLGEVTAGGPADRAGLRTGDEILAIDARPVADFFALRDVVAAAAGSSLQFSYRRGGVVRETRVEIEEVVLEGGRRQGRIQVAPLREIRYPDHMLAQTRLGPLAALGKATVDAWDMTVLQARMFWRMIVGQVSLKNLSGPLTIAEYAGETASLGVAAFVAFLVMVSLSLGFLNLLPIPMLDGGQVVQQAVEWIRGSPLPERVEALVQRLGIAVLFLLMGVALFNDIARQFA
ncbi:MAG: hypothetical protein RL026_244 [Pseudomonadota bacterium]|jgi:regulator of sigma E protease